MFLWGYRQVIAFFVLLVAFTLVFILHNKHYDLWLERLFTVLFVVGAIAWFARNVFRK